ncbi:hypothetical protein C0J52_07447 [Blattella germanica]|nr:hypothetical protein C0J52_07447 [Blattella germanica]
MYRLSSYIFSISIVCFSLYSFSSAKDHDWDILIFTQHWPLTVCLQWKEQLPQHSCLLPRKNAWTVHGIWPTKLGTKGPLFCNNSLHFNETQLVPIEVELEQYWADVHNSSGTIYQLWKHEWKKHGTCAVSLPALDSESKYFGQGLKWIKDYDMDGILSKSGIQPNANYTPQEVWSAVQKTLGKDPAVQCIVDPKTKVSYLFEIRICFDKNLTLVDCDGIREHEEAPGMKTNCPNRNLTYPAFLPPTQSVEPIDLGPSHDQRLWMLEGLRIVQFLQWMTF